MAVRVARELEAAGAHDVICAGGDTEQLQALGLTVVADDEPGQGPLGGLLSAFRATDAGELLVAPCDLLAPSAAAFATIVDALRATDAHAAIPMIDRVAQPLNGAYRAAAYQPLADQFARGERSVKRALRAIRVTVVHTVDRAALADADTPGDLVS
jgi:molybdopterin-guanine dinucleotide biosynthesis protein A